MGGVRTATIMRLRSLVVSTCCFVWIAGAWAQTHEDIAGCRIVADDARRLACYDAIRLSPSTPRGKYEPIALADLKTSALTYRGRLVEVIGWIRPERDQYVLGSAVGDPSPMPVDLRGLTRQERESLARHCLTVCEATIRGRVAPVNFVTGLVVETVVVH